MASLTPQTSRNENSITDKPADEFDTEALLKTISDEYTLKIIKALEETPQPCSDLQEKTDISKPTLYRRINKLKEMGIITEQTRLCPNGHHRSEYALKPLELEIDISREISLTKISTATPKQSCEEGEEQS